MIDKNEKVVIFVNKPEEEKTAFLDFSKGDQGIEPSEGKTMKRVVIPKPETLTPENIRAGVDIGGVVGILNSTDMLQQLVDNNHNGAANLFRYYQGTSLAFIQGLDLTNVDSLSYTFADCPYLTSVPTLNTPNLKYLTYTFYNCLALTTIPLINTSNVISMASAFYNSKKLTTIPALDASKVTTMSNAFYGCSSLKTFLMTGMKVSFDISASTQFDRNDLVTIIHNLAEVTTQQTLTMGATNLAKLDASDKETATDKGWTLA